MITKLILRNFKRFSEATFEIDPVVVLAGQNNSGKTTVIQAVAAWYYALQAWIRSGRRERSVGVPLQEFSSVSLREFNQLWTDKSTGFKKVEVGPKKQGTPRPLEIEVHGEQRGEVWSLAMEFKYSNKDQIYVKPTKVPGREIPEGAKALQAVHIPSFSGISAKETVFKPEYQDLLIGEGKPGDILRNRLKDVGEISENWRKLSEHVKNIFGYELLPPQHKGRAFILCEYRRVNADGSRSPLLDVNTAGSGFQQVLLLLAFLYSRPQATVLLIDEPDAHLHINLQSEVYQLLQDIARERGSQLLIATHSEVLIDTTNPRNIISFFGPHPHHLVNTHDRTRMQAAMKHLSSLDLLKAEQSGNRVLFVEGKTDFDILRAWAEVLKHRLGEWFKRPDDGTDGKAYWHDMKGKRPREAKEHFDALRAAFPEMKGFVLIDRDEQPNKDFGIHSGNPGIKLEKWARYETESYLVHPAAIVRLVENKAAGPLFDLDSKRAAKRAGEKLRDSMPPVFFDDPMKTTGYLEREKASEGILSPVFAAAGVPIGKNEYHLLAKVMKPEEIHSDVGEMLDAIADHFDIGKGEK